VEVKRLVTRSMSVGRELATKRIIKQFAHKFDLVYFGGIDPREEDFELIRGATLSTSHVDAHYCVGHFKGHDISLVERRNILSHPTLDLRKNPTPPHQISPAANRFSSVNVANAMLPSEKTVFAWGDLGWVCAILRKSSTHTYHWLIMQIDLCRREGLPHVFVDATQYDDAFYDTMRLRVPNLSYAGSLFVGHDPLFAQSFRVFAPIDRFDDVAELLNPAITSMLAYHFRQFDYEIGEDRILVYAHNPVVSLHLLREMLRVGSWLAMQLDWTNNR
jgi:hypothetical protein